jgi:hypothetical protein
MRFEQGKVTYEAGELEKYSPLWASMRLENDLQSRCERLSKQLFWASDAGLGDGTDPLYPAADEFAREIREKALRLNPQLSDKELHKFVFYVLHHRPGSAEYDVSTPPK